MKKLAIAALLFFGLVAVFNSCKKASFLDQTVTSSLDEETTFSDSSNAMQFLNNIYVNIGFATRAGLHNQALIGQAVWKLPAMKPKAPMRQAPMALYSLPPVR
jgi:hypothetical protein